MQIHCAFAIVDFQTAFAVLLTLGIQTLRELLEVHEYDSFRVLHSNVTYYARRSTPMHDGLLSVAVRENVCLTQIS